jgi:hypothetical protein
MLTWEVGTQIELVLHRKHDFRIIIDNHPSPYPVGNLREHSAYRTLTRIFADKMANIKPKHEKTSKNINLCGEISSLDL